MFRIKAARSDSGIILNETDEMGQKQANLLAERGVVFLTEFEVDGKLCGGSIIATSEEAAEKIAGRRGLGETVVGKLDAVGLVSETV